MKPKPNDSATESLGNLAPVACIALSTASLPAQAATATAAGGWAAALLGLLVGAGGGVAWGMRHRRALRSLRQQLDSSTSALQAQAAALQSMQQQRDTLGKQLQAQTAEFARQAHEDALTGLPNGRAFDEGFAHHFSRAKRHGQPLCLLLMDLDQFAQINENWSHATGDRVLEEVARLLRSVCRNSDLPARLGGDGFAVILTETDLEGGKRLSQRLHSAFAACRSWYDGELGPNYVSFSAGLVQLGEEDQAPQQMRQRADRALYLAKHAGGSRTSLG